ncbi:MAG: DUF1049 domain-containing protein [Candidatus Latescibacteria bacterium]|nr:DUF1049 domain-containing protein [bacterium]MBD3424982.1 DUF1049 domain-containing protein [Candidatus Latescibacterota bacterium]
MTGASRAKMITAIVFGALGIIIILQNYKDVETRVLFWRLTMPHVAVLGIVFAAGIILGSALAVMYCFRQMGKDEKKKRQPGRV